jgi:hypothetical protein
MHLLELEGQAPLLLELNGYHHEQPPGFTFFNPARLATIFFG